MLINWPLIMVLIGLSLPGILIAVPRLIHLLLARNSDQLKRRISRLGMVQTLFMVILMSVGGAVLSLRTGLNAPVLEGILAGKPVWSMVQAFLLPVFLVTLSGLVIFLLFYYGLMPRYLDQNTLTIMRRIRAALRPDGCVLYGGVVEEVIARWGLMNVLVYFSILLLGRNSELVVWNAMLISSLLLSLSHLPAYIAAGCKNNRFFLYSMVLLTGWQAVMFGWLFWQYGLLAAIISHMLFHLGWYWYDRA